MSYLYLDFDSFFAGAEQHFNAALRGKPVGVVPLDTIHTGCIAVSREAKAQGVPSSISIVEARKLLPEMIFVVARPDAYVRLHHRLLEVIEQCVPIAKVRSIDELVCKLVPAETADGEALAQRIKAALAQAFNPALTCSIGIAPTEMLAKVAAEMNKPDGFVQLHLRDIPGALKGLKLTDLPGVSSGIETRLTKAGICDVAALWNIGPKHARSLWGNIEGERFWNALHGRESVRPATTKRMFGHSRMLPRDWRTPDKMQACARQLVLSAGRRLRRAQLRATRMTLGMRGGGYRGRDRANSKSDHLRWSRESAFEPARDDRTFLRTLSALTEQFAREAAFAPRSVSVMLHGLTENEAQQGELFAIMQPKQVAPSSKWEKLADTMDAIRDTHGPDAATMGPKDSLPGGYLGAKIAFGRIPDLADFSDVPTKDSETHFLQAG